MFDLDMNDQNIIDNLLQTYLEFATEDLQFRILVTIRCRKIIHGDKPE